MKTAIKCRSSEAEEWREPAHWEMRGDRLRYWKVCYGEREILFYGMMETDSDPTDSTQEIKFS